VCLDEIGTSCVLGFAENGTIYVELGGTSNPVAVNATRIYRVVASVSATVWIPAFAACCAWIIILLWRRRDRELGGVELGLVVLILLNALAFSMYLDQRIDTYNYPTISVEWSYNISSNTITARLPPNVTIEGIECWYAPPRTSPLSRSLGDENHTLDAGVVNGSSIVIAVPDDLYREYYTWYSSMLNTSGIKSLPPKRLSINVGVPIRCRFVLSGGVKIVASYTLAFKLRDLELRNEGSRIIVVNPNPVPVNATIYVLDAQKNVVY